LTEKFLLLKKNMVIALSFYRMSQKFSHNLLTARTSPGDRERYCHRGHTGLKMAMLYIWHYICLPFSVEFFGG
jgi:hypothetical protein